MPREETFVWNTRACYVPSRPLGGLILPFLTLSSLAFCCSDFFPPSIPRSGPASVNKRVADLSDELARKVEDTLRQQEEISCLLAQIVDLQARCKGVRRAHTHLHTHTYTHTPTHTHLHTHTHTDTHLHHQNTHLHVQTHTYTMHTYTLSLI